MMHSFQFYRLSGWLFVVLISLSVGIYVAWIEQHPNSQLRRWWSHYLGLLTQQFKGLRRSGLVNRVAYLQLGIAVGALFCALLFYDAFWLLLVPLVMMVPWLVLRSLQKQRIDAIESQLERWVLTLSNNLRAAPSIGDALANTVAFTALPLRDELEQVVQELRVGANVDEALENFRQRVPSAALASVVTALSIGRQTGGDLSAVLEQSAATLREMFRLEGVVQTKTADGRNQAYLLAVMPFLLLGIIHAFDSTWFAPLLNQTMGYVVIFVAVAAWLIALFWAKKIMTVDL
ncbi:MAG: type II secretion system F family protein [Myxococcales bacterium]|nr:MAG: type II secretion system F family protein [Myxococcales bacterium]